MQDHAIGTLDLAVSSSVSNYRLIHMDVMLVIEVQELFASELHAVVGEDDVGYPKSVDYDGEDEDTLLGANVHDGSSLDLF